MCSVQPLCCDFTERGVPEELLSRFKDYNGMTLSLGSETEGLFHRIPSQPACMLLVAYTALARIITTTVEIDHRPSPRSLLR